MSLSQWLHVHHTLGLALSHLNSCLCSTDINIWAGHPLFKIKREKEGDGESDFSALFRCSLWGETPGLLLASSSRLQGGAGLQVRHPYYFMVVLPHRSQSFQEKSRSCRNTGCNGQQLLDIIGTQNQHCRCLWCRNIPALNNFSAVLHWWSSAFKQSWLRADTRGSELVQTGMWKGCHNPHRRRWLFSSYFSWLCFYLLAGRK